MNEYWKNTTSADSNNNNQNYSSLHSRTASKLGSFDNIGTDSLNSMKVQANS